MLPQRLLCLVCFIRIVAGLSVLWCCLHSFSFWRPEGWTEGWLTSLWQSSVASGGLFLFLSFSLHTACTTLRATPWLYYFYSKKSLLRSQAFILPCQWGSLCLLLSSKQALAKLSLYPSSNWAVLTSRGLCVSLAPCSYFNRQQLLNSGTS